MKAPQGVRSAGWIAIPFVAYLALLLPLAFDAPIFDDYEAILGAAVRFHDARGAAEWLAIVADQHNEHRIATLRGVVWLMVQSAGQVDFRVLAALGNLGLAVVLWVLWAQFRETVAAPVLGAAGFALCQLSYFESALMAMAACSNILVVGFALASFVFALRPGRLPLAAALALGLLAAATQASGLLTLPLAAAGCALLGRTRRAWAFAAFAALAWIAYFAGYQSPPGHGTWLQALRHPADAVHFFLVVVGAMAPGLWPATLLGGALLGVLAALTLDGAWRRRPAIALCVAFLLLSAAAIALARASFGVAWVSRYAIASSALVAIVFLLVVERAPWGVPGARAAFVAAAAAWLTLSWALWPSASSFAGRGRELAKEAGAGTDASQPYVGIQHPRVGNATRILAQAEALGLYRVREKEPGARAR